MVWVSSSLRTPSETMSRTVWVPAVIGFVNRIPAAGVGVQVTDGVDLPRVDQRLLFGVGRLRGVHDDRVVQDLDGEERLRRAVLVAQVDGALELRFRRRLAGVHVHVQRRGHLGHVLEADGVVEEERSSAVHHVLRDDGGAGPASAGTVGRRRSIRNRGGVPRLDAAVQPCGPDPDSSEHAACCGHSRPPAGPAALGLDDQVQRLLAVNGLRPLDHGARQVAEVPRDQVHGPSSLLLTVVLALVGLRVALVARERGQRGAEDHDHHHGCDQHLHQRESVFRVRLSEASGHGEAVSEALGVDSPKSSSTAVIA